MFVVNDAAVLKAEIGCHAGKALRVERQQALEALEGVQDQHRDDAERQHRDRVLRPPHLVPLIHAGQPVDQPLERPQDRVKPGALAREHPRHERAERHGHGRDRREEEQNLNPTIERHVSTS